jgi:triosephosphate isomerase
VALAAGTVVAVSLKAYFGARQTVDWCRAVADVVKDCEAVGLGTVDVVVLPSAPMLSAALEVFAGTGIQVGAQDLHWETGPWTGAVSAPLLAELGCTVAEVGHAERRVLGDTDETVGRKAAAAVAAGMSPLVCVGEGSRGRPSAAADECLGQLSAVLPAGGTGALPLLVAYEPVWAIGAADPAPTEHVDEVTSRLAAELPRLWPSAPARVLYGGSAGPGLFGRLGPPVAGLFLGRFGHDISRFAEVLREAAARATNDDERTNA